VRYHDENFEYFEEEFSGRIARVIQHEYDHLEGKLFTDHISSLKKTLLKGKLNDISKGRVSVDYKMKFNLK
jgi:peptide deformylase